MNSPSTTSFARFAHSTGIDKVQVGRTGRGRGQGPLRKQRTAKLAWPNPALAQSFQKGHIRQIGQLRVLGANNGFAQRKTATQMHQQNAQIACFRFILGESPKRAGSFRLHSPIRWKEGHQHFPIFSQTIGVIVFHAPKSARKRGSGGGGAVFWPQLGRGVGLSKEDRDAGRLGSRSAVLLGDAGARGYFWGGVKGNLREPFARTGGGERAQRFFRRPSIR